MWPRDFDFCLKIIKKLKDIKKIALAYSLQLELWRILATEIYNDLALKSLISYTKCIWPLVNTNKYLCCLKVKALFMSTYLCELSFSNISLINKCYNWPFGSLYLNNLILFTFSSTKLNLHSPNVNIYKQVTFLFWITMNFNWWENW